MNQNPRGRDAIDLPPPGFVWAGAVLLVAGMLHFMTDWHRLAVTHAAGGRSENLIWAVAGYTLPLTSGFALCGFLVIRYFEYPEQRRFNGAMGRCGQTRATRR